MVDDNKIIKINPRMICSSCYKENCDGECWLIIRFIRWLKKITKTEKNEKF